MPRARLTLNRLSCASIQTLIYRCVCIEDFYIPVLADFALATWFPDKCCVAPYLSVVGLQAIWENNPPDGSQLGMPSIAVG